MKGEKRLIAQFQPFPELVTKRLRLRQLINQDAPEQFLCRNDEEMIRLINTRRLDNTNEAITLIHSLNQGIAENRWIVWVLMLQTDCDHRFMGSICLWNFSTEDQTAELGYGILPPYQGQGYMDEAVKAVLQYGFHQMDLASITAITEATNQSSLALLSRNRFIEVEDFLRIDRNFRGDELRMKQFSLKRGNL